jgi:3-hydroxyisobutyrate dehydrogenase-like beta-hydroxyacid dehydrogenase
LASERIRAVEDASVAAASVLIAGIVVVTYDDALAVLAQLGPALPEVVVNLTTGYHDDARRALDWYSHDGIGHLDGAIFAYPQQISRTETALAVSGDEALRKSWTAMIIRLGGASRHAGTSIGSANVLDTGVVGAFYLSALGAYLEALAYLLVQGAAEEHIAEAVSAITSIIQQPLHEVTRAAVSESYRTDQATLGVIAHSVRGFVDTMKATGHATGSLKATHEMCDTAPARLGGLAFYSIVEQLRAGRRA